MSAFCQEMKKHMNRKVGSEGTPKLGAYWKLQLVACKVNMELRSELCLGVRISHGLNKQDDNEQETSEIQFE